MRSAETAWRAPLPGEWNECLHSKRICTHADATDYVCYAGGLPAYHNPRVYGPPKRIDGQGKPATDWTPSEPEEIIAIFSDMLRKVLGDGAKKRQAGTKPSWKVDSHEPALWSHINKWKHGELVDEDSGAHPLTHQACRALMIAWQETEKKRLGLRNFIFNNTDSPEKPHICAYLSCPHYNRECHSGGLPLERQP